MTNSLRRDNPPLLIVSIKIFLTFLPALLENADKATSPIAFAYENKMKRKIKNQKVRWKKIAERKRNREKKIVTERNHEQNKESKSIILMIWKKNLSDWLYYYETI